MNKFKGKYRIESNRLFGWDYSSKGLYFITIVTAKRKCYFGDIADGKMIYNDFGKIAYDEWFKSFEIRHELFTDAFVLMTDHLHGIVMLDKNDDMLALHKDAKLMRKPESISSFVAGYKSVVISRIDDLIDHYSLPVCKFNRQNPLWQANYYDHIIRDDKSYWKIKYYIENNPMTWYRERNNL